MMPAPRLSAASRATPVPPITLPSRERDDLGDHPDLQRGGEPRPDRPRRRGRAGALRSGFSPDPDRRRQLARRHRRRSPTSWPAELERGRGPAPPGQGRARAGLPGRVRPRPRRRRRARDRDGRRLLARSALPAGAAGGGPGRRPRAGLALRAGRRRPQLGLRAAPDQPRRRPLRPHDPACRRPRSHRRLQVHPARGAGGDPPRDACEPRATCSRSRSPTGPLLAGFRVREIPIVFADRTAGKSKMSTRIALEAMWLVPAIRRGAAAALSGTAAPKDAGPSPRARAAPNVIPTPPKPHPAGRRAS